jgi:3',5'-nucleoside bisphosphate phosphatase
MYWENEIRLKADLHLHTTASDGLLNPHEVVDLTVKSGLNAISITDHDTIDGYLAVREYATAKGIHLVCGAELTTDFAGRECHILAYDFDVEHPTFSKMLAGQRVKRRTRANAIVSKLNKLGFDLDINEVQAESGKATISRNHIAAALQRKRFVTTKREAFDRYLHSNGPAYVTNNYPEVSNVIQLIREAGGVSILAHPGKSYIYKDLKYFMDSGLDGIEYLHPSHSYLLQKKYKEYALNYGLLLSGGSDFHGSNPHEEQNLGTICVDMEKLDKILELSGKRKVKIESQS